MTLAVYEPWELKDFLRTQERNVRDAHFHVTEHVLTDSVQVWGRKDWWVTSECETKRIRTRTQSQEWKERGRRQNLKHSDHHAHNPRTECDQLCTTVQGKSINYASQDWFLTRTVPWAMPWHRLGRCQELNSMDNCGTVLKPAFGPFWFIFIDTVIKSQILPWNGKMTGTDPFTLFWEEMVY